MVCLEPITATGRNRERPSVNVDEMWDEPGPLAIGTTGGLAMDYELTMEIALDASAARVAADLAAQADAGNIVLAAEAEVARAWARRVDVHLLSLEAVALAAGVDLGVGA